MEFLEGLLAFSVVMILLATLVSGIVEVFARLIALRAEVLAQMIERLLKEELWPRLEAEMPELVNAATQTTKEKLSAVVNTMTINPLLKDSNPGLLGKLRRRISWRKQHLDRVDVLSTWAFLQRLAKTEVGATLLKAGDDQVKAVLVDTTRTFERYAAASQEVFRKKANTYSMAIAIVTAFALNINAPILLDYLVVNPSARKALIAMGEEAGAAASAQKTATEKALSALGSGASGSEREIAARELKQAFARFNTASANVEELKKLGLPIFYTHHNPFKRNTTSQNSDTKSENSSSDGEKDTFSWKVFFWKIAESVLLFAFWLIGVFLGGILIGLGGPFWYKVFDGLSQLSKLLRGLGGKPRELAADPNEEKEVVIGGPKDALDPDAMLEAFKLAAGPGAKEYVVCA